jgi:hypothetical protein
MRPTLQGVREGRGEVYEAGIAVLRELVRRR